MVRIMSQLLVVLVLIFGSTLLRTAYPEESKTNKLMSPHASIDAVRLDIAKLMSPHASIDAVRLDIAAASIDMMQEDTVEAAKQSQFIDIGPFYDLVDDALDRFGVRGVYMNLFESHKFVEALTEVAKAENLKNFNVLVSHDEGGSGQPITEYTGIPNDRKSYHRKTICSGCKWWLNHYVGAITADKLLRDGSLLLDEVTMDRVYDAPSFMKEIQRIERLDDSDIMVFHAQHGFTWQYLAAKKPMLDSYPLEEAEAFCGDLLYTSEYIGHVSNDMARECRHGFGHGVFYVLARQQMSGSAGELDGVYVSARHQLRPVSGFLLSDALVCKAYEICNGAPNKLSYKQCRGGLRHSYKILGHGDRMKDGTSIVDHLKSVGRMCGLKAYAPHSPASSDVQLSPLALKILKSTELISKALDTPYQSDPCLPTKTTNAKYINNTTIKERGGQIDTLFGWDRIDVSKTGLCGAFKCYFTDSKYDSVGYLVSRNDLEDDKEWGSEFDDGWKISQYLEKALGLNHTLLSPPQRVFVTPSSPLLTNSSLQTVQASKNHSTIYASKMYKSGQEVILQKVRAAPRHSEFIKSAHAWNDTGALLDKLLAISSNKRHFLENLTHEARSAAKVCQIEPLLALDFQIMVDAEGNIYHIDLDRVFTNKIIYASNEEFVKKLRKRLQRCFNLFNNFESWLTSNIVAILGTSTALDLRLPRKQSGGEVLVEGITGGLDHLKVPMSCFAQEHVDKMYQKKGKGFNRIPNDGPAHSLVTGLIQRIADNGFYDEREEYG